MKVDNTILIAGAIAAILLWQLSQPAKFIAGQITGAEQAVIGSGQFVGEQIIGAEKGTVDILGQIEAGISGIYSSFSNVI